jgi:hypothetical protein
MSGITFHTLRDLLLPNNDQDIRIILTKGVEEQITAGAIQTSPFHPKKSRRDPNRLPISAHLSIDLPSRMRAHLGTIIDQDFSDQVARTSFAGASGDVTTPGWIIRAIRECCATYPVDLSHEPSITHTVESLSQNVGVIYRVLTGEELNLRRQDRTENGSVVTDYAFRLRGRIAILWENKSSRTFDRFIGAKDSAQREFHAGPNGATIRYKTRRRGIERNHDAWGRMVVLWVVDIMQKEWVFCLCHAEFHVGEPERYQDRVLFRVINDVFVGRSLQCRRNFLRPRRPFCEIVSLTLRSAWKFHVACDGPN